MVAKKQKESAPPKKEGFSIIPYIVGAIATLFIVAIALVASSLIFLSQGDSQNLSPITKILQEYGLSPLESGAQMPNGSFGAQDVQTQSEEGQNTAQPGSTIPTFPQQSSGTQCQNIALPCGNGITCCGGLECVQGICLPQMGCQQEGDDCGIDAAGNFFGPCCAGFLCEENKCVVDTRCSTAGQSCGRGWGAECCDGFVCENNLCRGEPSQVGDEPQSGDAPISGQDGSGTQEDAPVDSNITEIEAYPVFECADSDGGDNPGVWGIVITSEGVIAQDICDGETRVLEFYCGTQSHASNLHECEDGFCMDGVCVPSGTQNQQMGECVDSDGGMNYYVFGTATDDNAAMMDSCLDGSSLQEYYCDGGVAEVSIYTCAAGETCSNGACVAAAPPPPVCTDSDGGKDYYVQGTATNSDESVTDSCSDSMVVEAFCEDGEVKIESHLCAIDEGCYEGRCVQVPQAVANSEACSDTDGGNAPSIFGTITTAGGFVGPDYCHDAITITEFFCTENGYATMFHECQQGYLCIDGLCVSQTECTDSDGGQNLLVKGTTTLGQLSGTDFCNGAEVVEYYCTQAGEYASTSLPCPFGKSCLDGVCADITCSDSDGGKDYIVKGTLTSAGQTYTDTCVSDRVLREYYCDANIGAYEDKTCPLFYTCSKGKCVHT